MTKLWIAYHIVHISKKKTASEIEIVNIYALSCVDANVCFMNKILSVF